eukprot:scaffold1490_cov162-Ochromonas_danica.AAC.4
MLAVFYSAPSAKQRYDISSEASFRLLHSLRAEHEAVLIGANTLSCDRPRLTVRSPLAACTSSRNPRPVVLDSQLRILGLPADAMLLQRPLVFTCVAPEDERFGQAEALLRPFDGQLFTCRADSRGRCDFEHCLRVLRQEMGVRTLLIEGGAEVIQSALELKVIDQVVVTVKTSFFGGYRSMTRQLEVPLTLIDVAVGLAEGDIILHGLCAQ